MDDELISEVEARTLFEPHFARIADCLDTGWEAWEKVAKTAEGRRLGKSARARIVWDHASGRAVDLFGPDPSVGMLSIRGLTVFDFGEALLRFKKLDRGLQTRGIETAQQQMFANQTQVAPVQMTLWRPSPMVVAGYVLDRLESAIERRLLVLLKRGRVIWKIDLPSSADRMPTPLPSPQGGPIAPTPRSLRTVRREDEEAE